MPAALQDVRLALRALARAPGFTLAAIATLAPGIGAATAILTVVDGVLLRELPYRDPGRLVVIWNDFGEGSSAPAVSPPDFRDYRAWCTRFEGFAAAQGGSVALSGDGPPEQVQAAWVTASLLPLLGVDPILGRHLLESEEAVGGPAVVLLSHGLWQRRFGGDPDVVGRRITIATAPHTVIGVLPARFRLELPPGTVRLREDVELWMPVQMPYDLVRRQLTVYTVLGRLGPGVGLERAGREMDGVAARLRREHAIHESAGLRIRVAPLHEAVAGHARPALLILLGAAGLLLVIACANVAGLLLVRGTRREREMAIRAALGAGPRRLFGHVLAESAVLALLGGVAGLGLAHLALPALLAARPEALEWLRGSGGESIAIDGAAVAFAAALTALAETLAAGIWPGRRAVGRRLLVPALGRHRTSEYDRMWAEVIGVVGHTRSDELARAGGGQIFFSTRQFWRHERAMVVHAGVAPLGLARAAAGAVAALDPDIPISDVRTIESLVRAETAPTRFLLLLVGLFATVATGMVAVGLYGVVSQSASLRRREIGVRLALGAGPRSILGLIIRQGLVLAGLGLVPGAVGALLLTRSMSSVLVGVRPADPPTLIAVTCLLVLVAAAASYVPARRATRVDPAIALRSE